MSLSSDGLRNNYVQLEFYQSEFSNSPFYFSSYRCESNEINFISDAEDYCTSCSDAESDNEACIGSYEKSNADEKLALASIDEDVWIDEYDETNTCEKPMQSRFKMSNSVQATHLLSDESINSLLNQKEECKKGRKCTLCPNDGECGESFGPIKRAREIIRTFRKKYWNDESESGQIYLRRKQLLQDLDAMTIRNTETSQITIQYKIDGIFVCKSFFYVSISI